MATKAVAKQEEAAGSIQAWAPAQVDAAELAEVLEASPSTEGFGPRDLEMIKIPAGGQLIWDIPTMDGRDGARHFDAVVLHYHTHRKWWEQAYGAGPVGPPDCESNDGLLGLGNPGGACKQCPLNHVKRSREDRTCPPRQYLFLMLPEMPMPVLLDLPVTSLAVWGDYVNKALKARLKLPWRVITRFELNKATATLGNDNFSRLSVSLVADIPKEEWAAIEGYRQALIKPLEASYELRKQTHRELAQGVSGAQNLWDSEPMGIEIPDDDDDLPEIGEAKPEEA